MSNVSNVSYVIRLHIGINISKVSNISNMSNFSNMSNMSKVSNVGNVSNMSNVDKLCIAKLSLNSTLTLAEVSLSFHSSKATHPPGHPATHPATHPSRQVVSTSASSNK